MVPWFFKYFDFLNDALCMTGLLKIQNSFNLISQFPTTIYTVKRARKWERERESSKIPGSL